MRAQTSTEYLIVLAVVIIIALIVVGVLGGIPGLGGGTGEGTNKAVLATAGVGISEYTVTCTNTKLTVVNNQRDTIQLNDLAIEGETCYFLQDGLQYTPQLTPGERAALTCIGYQDCTSGESYELDLALNYTNMKTGTTLIQEISGGKLMGTTASHPYNDSVIAGTAWTGGAGTVGDPYLISNCNQLQNMDPTFGGVYYRLANVIDCTDTQTWNSGLGFDPVDVGYLDDTYLDGNDYSIVGLYINRPATLYVGLFSLTDGLVNMSHVNFIDVSITGSSGVGALASVQYGSIEVDNIYVSGTVSGGSSVGGLAGEACTSGDYSMSIAGAIDISDVTIAGCGSNCAGGCAYGGQNLCGLENECYEG